MLSQNYVSHISCSSAWQSRLFAKVERQEKKVKARDTEGLVRAIGEIALDLNDRGPKQPFERIARNNEDPGTQLRRVQECFGLVGKRQYGIVDRAWNCSESTPGGQYDGVQVQQLRGDQCLELSTRAY